MNILDADTQGFEGGVGDWTLTGYARDNSSAEAGSWSISVSVASGPVTSQAVTPAGTSGYEVTPGVTYHLTAFHQVTGAVNLASTPRVRLAFYDSGGTLTHTMTAEGLVSRVGEGFKRVGFKVTAPAGAAFMSVFLQSSTAQSGTRQAYFDEIWLEELAEAGAERSVVAQWGGSSGTANYHSSAGSAMPFTVSAPITVGGIAVRHESPSAGRFQAPPLFALDYAAGATAVDTANHRLGISDRITSSSGHTTSTVPWLAYADADVSTDLNIYGWTYYLFATPIDLLTGTDYSLTSIEIPGLARPVNHNFPGLLSTKTPLTGPVALDGNMVICGAGSPFVNFDSTSTSFMPNVRFLGAGGWQVGSVAL